MADVQYLSDQEIEDFLHDLDKNNDGDIAYNEVEYKLDEVHKEIAPEAKPHNLHFGSEDDERRHKFLRSVIGTDKNRISREEFAHVVKQWKIPSLEQDKKAEKEEKEYVGKMPIGRRLRAYWAVDGPEYVFLALVVSMQIAFGTWQLVKYLTGEQYRHAFGWGVVLAKTSAGALYPTLFFLVFSMSRYLATFARKSYYVSRLINWDLSQSFHVKISIITLLFATLHAIGHLTGTFLYGSQSAQESAVALLLGPESVPRPYQDYVASRPGWTGLAAFGLFWILAGFSMPMVRKWSYEVFQLGHLLMFPILGLLFFHGTSQLLQHYMLGYWLAVPTFVVIIERSLRLIKGFLKVPAKLEILDSETVCITCTIPNRRFWPYKAGQYVLLQVPQLSFFQWHPFTISTCIGREMTLHIKTDGDWTSQLRSLQKETGSELKYVGIDGPFGAPAQRFYDFDQTIVLGSGIGITPFSGILADLQERENRRLRNSSSDTQSEETTVVDEPARETPGTQPQQSAHNTAITPLAARDLHNYRRVDFHWIVKDRNALLWFSDLLNTIFSSPSSHAHVSNPSLAIHIATHVTQKRKNISTHIFRALLERHRTDTHPESPLTGLLNETHFGRPDLQQILDEHYADMQRLRAEDGGSEEKRKVGVFFCGAPVIGYEVADRCQLLTLRGREDRSFIEYHFMMEVFG